MQDAIAFFALRLTAGIGIMLLLMPRKSVTSEFFRILMLVCLGLSVVSTLTSAGGMLGPISICIAAFLGSVFWLLERRALGTTALFVVSLMAIEETGRAIFRLAALDDETTSAVADTATTSAQAIVPLLFSTIASTGTLGAAMAGMLLGHRYLTAPGMPLVPLFRLNDALGLTGLLRMAVSGVLLMQHGLPGSGSGPLVWLMLRWLAGIAGPLVVWLMVRRILRYRNTQSATGVLFVGVILTFLGELSGDLLYRTTGISY